MKKSSLIYLSIFIGLILPIIYLVLVSIAITYSDTHPEILQQTPNFIINLTIPGFAWIMSITDLGLIPAIITFTLTSTVLSCVIFFLLKLKFNFDF